MSETPRTDRMVASWPLESFGEMTGLARQLERENAALREQLAGRTEQLEVSIQNNALIKNGLLKRAERAEAQLAEALEENARLDKLVSSQGIQLMEVAETDAELAKLRQHAEAMADDLDRFAAQPDYDGQLYGPMPSLIAFRASFPEM